MFCPYPGCPLISLWCDSDDKTLIFLRFRILAFISGLLILAIIKICYFLLYTPAQIISKYLQCLCILATSKILRNLYGAA